MFINLLSTGSFAANMYQLIEDIKQTNMQPDGCGHTIFFTNSVIWINIQRCVSRGRNCTRTFNYAPHITELKAEERPNLENKRLRVQFLEADLVTIPLPLFVAEWPEPHTHRDVGVRHPCPWHSNRCQIRVEETRKWPQTGRLE